MARVVLVTGASRGIGLGLVRELVRVGGYTVVATCRSPATATTLQEVLATGGHPSALPLDVTSDESIAIMAAAIKVDSYF